jgi:hypothetical protein
MLLRAYLAFGGGKWGDRPRPRARALRSSLSVSQTMFSGKFEMLIHSPFKIILQGQIPYCSSAVVKITNTRGGVSSTRDLGPTMTARGQSIAVSIGMLPQTLIVSRLDQLSLLGARI